MTPQVGGTEFVRNDVTSQQYAVKFPDDFTCDNCTIRLLRQADEWSNGYRFWSCADIDIKPSKYIISFSFLNPEIELLFI